MLMKNLWGKFVNRETVSYVFFGVLTTAVDWIVYPITRHFGAPVALATFFGWAAAVTFAFVTNKIYVFESHVWSPVKLAREFGSFVACRALSGFITIAAMVIMVDIMHWNEYLGKLLVSAMSLVLNYIFSKWFVFKKPSDREV